MKRYACFFSFLLLSINNQADALSFSQFGLTHWAEKSFSGHTQYLLITDGDEKIVHATADSSASGLFNKHKINLEKTPQITWRWKIKQIGQNNDERSKSGDDYPLRLYVIVKGEPHFWNNFVLVYVWSNNAAVESSWENPFASEFTHIAVETGEQHLGQWRDYSRNVQSDFNNVFGFKPKSIDAIAIMTDSDNSNQKFEAWYGDIKFSKGGIND